MTHASPAQTTRDWYEKVWSEGRADLITVLAGPETVFHGLDETGAKVVGAEAFRPFYEKLRAAMPDISFTIHEMLESGSTVACRWTATGTHAGDHLGPPATNRQLTVSGMSFARVENGVIVEGWNEWDRLSFAVAIGALVPPG